MAEDEMIGWHHQLTGHEFEQTLGVGDGQGSLAWGCKWAFILLFLIEREIIQNVVPTTTLQQVIHIYTFFF